MVVNVWLVLDPGGDRPYVMTTAPETHVRTPGMRVFRYELEVPEPVAVDAISKATPVEEQ